MEATTVNGTFRVTALSGDFKTLLAFDLGKDQSKGLAGFTIQVQPGTGSPYYLLNSLQFEDPSKHAQDQAQPATSSINAPFRKFRWLHVPGQFHQGLAPFRGSYAYTATRRYFDRTGSLLPLDPALSATVHIPVQPFVKDGLHLGFARGFVQSQAFVHHFGPKALVQPRNPTIDFDTSQVSGKNAAGEAYTFAQQYAWLGSTAREQIFTLLHEIRADQNLKLDVFAYDLKEPDIITAFLALAGEQRIRIVLDNASLHSSTAAKRALEDDFEDAFRRHDGRGAHAPIIRGHFGRYSHDKVLIVSGPAGPQCVLTGSTNFSVTGMYVNSNHVLVFESPAVASQYQQIFDWVFTNGALKKAYLGTEFSPRRYHATSPVTMSATFAPHTDDITGSVLGAVVDRIRAEGKRPGGSGSVLFAVMDLSEGHMVADALRKLHVQRNVFSYGITDSVDGIELYRRGSRNGVLTTGKPVRAVLPPPFDQVPGIGGGAAHQVHHKFVVCGGIHGTDPTVFCGSSNLAEGGESNNGDNLLEIHDADVALAFAIEAIGLVDHFAFLDRYATGPGAPQMHAVADKHQAAVDAGSFLHTDDAWVQTYYDSSDLHSVERTLFSTPS
jgi:hypothetical protein